MNLQLYKIMIKFNGMPWKMSIIAYAMNVDNQIKFAFKHFNQDVFCSPIDSQNSEVCTDKVRKLVRLVEFLRLL